MGSSINTCTHSVSHDEYCGIPQICWPRCSILTSIHSASHNKCCGNGEDVISYPTVRTLFRQEDAIPKGSKILGRTGPEISSVSYRPYSREPDVWTFQMVGESMSNDIVVRNVKSASPRVEEEVCRTIQLCEI